MLFRAAPRFEPETGTHYVAQTPLASAMLSSASSRLPVPLRFALRELRAGLGGFGIFLACLALGVAAIAGVGSVSRSLSEGLAREGRAINGGDIAFGLVSREATAAESAILVREGVVSVIATTRAMARTADGRSTLVEIKAVDAAYPLSGEASTDAGPLQPALAPGGDGKARALGDLALFARLDLKAGDTLTLGTSPIVLAGAVTGEPDKLAGGIGFGPRLMTSLDTLRATGLIQPGSLVRWTYRVALPAGADPKAALARVNAAAPDAGWEARTRDDASPALQRSIERFTLFLTLVALTALLVGGVGVANAVRAFVERKRDTIATLKALGAPGSRVVAIYLAQTLLLALAGTAIGLLVGAALPFAVAALFGAILPLPLEPAVFPRELLLALAYGLMTALVFSLWPLGRAHDMPVSALFRDAMGDGLRRPRARYLLLAGAAGLGLAALAVAFASDRTLALVYVGGALAAVLALRLVAFGVMVGVRRLPRPRGMALRLALANIHRPGALTPAVILSLGLGLCLLVTLGQIDGNIRRQLSAAIPDKAPSFFFVDIPDAEGPRFDAFVAGAAPGAHLDRVPMLRGRIVSVKGVPAEKITPPADIAWVMTGDRGITFSSALPAGSTVSAGAWWPADYAGPSLVSMEDRIAHGLGLDVGDTIGVNVLGRTIEARIGALRKLEWESFGINFVMVFSPNTFRGAPVMHLATLRYPDGTPLASEIGLLKSVAGAFPTVTTVRVKDALDAVAGIAAQLALAIRGAASIALLASVLVLGGALAAGHRARLYDAVVLKVLGATRARLLLAFALEYGLLGLVTAAFGIATGTLAAWLIVTRLMDFAFVPLAGPAVTAALGGLALTLALGLAGTWRILGQRPGAHLKSL